MQPDSTKFVLILGAVRPKQIGDASLLEQLAVTVGVDMLT
ncbi:hypothetical protein Thiowin_03775 [Thiorhodovibrio winogradskyi]|uniref:Uncharacterized protein n=1 Tax=Thiorhodovibrio winogradskyi TaxID=77007 RepID=A0ABZ0SEJ2_9GAMM